MEQQREKLLAGVASWVAFPLPQVGSKSTGLAGAPRGQDVYSVTGCRGGSFTSWAQGSVSALASLQLYAGSEAKVTRLTCQQPLGDVMTDAEMLACPESKLRLYHAGVLTFYRGIGLLTVKQTQSRKYAPLLKGRNAPEKSASSSSMESASSAGPSKVAFIGPPLAVDAWGAYSDTVPVYCINVNSWATENEEVPYSSLFNHVADRITDPNATGALGALVRGTTMKDSASIITLVKHMQKGSGSYKEVAPLVRCMNMLNAVSVSGVPPDPIVHKFVRNFAPTGGPILEIFQGNLVGGHVFAVAHDMFMEHVFLNFNTPFPGIGGRQEEFALDAMDSTWVAIPVSSDIVRSKALIPYMLSFLSSAYTNGTVNHIVEGRFSWTEAGVQKERVGSMRLFPRANLAHIPGAIHAILVLTDCTAVAAPGSIVGVGFDIPVASTRRDAALDPTNIDDILRTWWSPFDPISGGSDIISAIVEIESKLCISGVSKLASGIAAEVNGAQYPGMMIPTQAVEYNTEVALYGAWVLGGDDHPRLFPESDMRASNIPISEDNTSARRLMIGYNFAAISPLARPYSGVATTSNVNSLIHPHPGRRWSTGILGKTSPAMTIKCMDSMSRVATYMGLVVTEDIQSGFTSVSGAQGWFRMLSMALTLQVSLLFARADLSLRVWAGFDSVSGDLTTRNTYTQFIRMATNGLCGYIDVSLMIEPWLEWDEDCVSEYYGMDPFENENWLSYHPVPSLMTAQWSRKMGVPCDKTPATTVFRHEGVHRRGLLLTHDTASCTLEASQTIDFHRYAPIILYTTNDCIRQEAMGMWVDCDPYITNTITKAHASQPRTIMVNGTLALSTQHLATEIIEPRKMYVLGSHLDTTNYDMLSLRVTDIQYPDPITLDGIIRAGKKKLPAVPRTLGSAWIYLRRSNGSSGGRSESHSEPSDEGPDSARAPRRGEGSVRSDEGETCGGYGRWRPRQEDGRKEKYHTSIMEGVLPPAFQSVYKSILDSGILEVIYSPKELRLRPGGLEKLQRLRGGVPKDWPINVSVSCAWPLYFYYLALKSVGQVNSARDLRYILGVIRARWNRVAHLYDLTCIDDFFRLNLRAISSFCFPLIFEKGPVFQLFTHLHALTGKCPYTKDQIIDDINDWVGSTIDGREKGFSEEVVNATLDRVFSNWQPSEPDGALSFEEYCNDFIRWGTSGGGPKSNILGSEYRTKWAWAFSNYTNADGSARTQPDLYGESLKVSQEATIALKEEAPKTREIIATPMSSYLRQSYLLYRWGKPNLPSPISSANWVSQFERVNPKWFGCIDGEKFDRYVPKSFVIAVLTRLGNLDAETVKVVEQELGHLEGLSLEFQGHVWLWLGGLLSGWRFTSLLGTIASICAANHIISSTGTNGSVEVGAMGDDLVLWSYTVDISPDVLVSCYNNFGLRANLKKTISGSSGEFLRKVLTKGGNLGYPSLGARTLFYANPWVSNYRYEMELELSNSWLTFISRLHRHGVAGTDYKALYISWISRALSQEFGTGKWDDWVQTPVSAGGGGPIEFSNFRRWTTLSHEVKGDSYWNNRYWGIAARIGILKSKLVFVKTAHFVNVPLDAVLINYKQLMGSISEKDVVNIRKSTNLTSLIFGLASGKLNRADINDQLRIPLTAAQRGLSVMSFPRGG